MGSKFWVIVYAERPREAFNLALLINEELEGYNRYILPLGKTALDKKEALAHVESHNVNYYEKLRKGTCFLLFLNKPNTFLIYTDGVTEKRAPKED